MLNYLNTNHIGWCCYFLFIFKFNFYSFKTRSIAAIKHKKSLYLKKIPDEKLFIDIVCAPVDV